ncbi:winged helix-turn-helix transcriptional regulator [Halarcobacter sp.]|uniref:winged helix-turn-helix transcriptional regulator n=1 Tax=Halarcobacter sp. TaxID=2321133 RepID=UPI003A8CEFE9
MRLLTYNLDEKLLEYIDEEQLYIVDIAEDISDAIYHSEVRYYNLVIVDCNNYFDCKKILRNIDNRVTAVVFLVDDWTKQLEVSLLKKGAISVLKKPTSNEYILAKMESIHRDNFKKELFYKDNYKADLEEKALVSDDKKVVFKGKSFSILSYLIKNRYRAPISKDELLQANWDEPEMVSDNVIEVNINSIRNSLKKEFDENFIETVRHRGYKVSI